MQMQALIVVMLQMPQGWQVALDLPLPGQIYSVAPEDAKRLWYEKIAQCFNTYLGSIYVLG